MLHAFRRDRARCRWVTVAWLVATISGARVAAADEPPARAVVHLIAFAREGEAYRTGAVAPVLWSADVTLVEGNRTPFVGRGELSFDRPSVGSDDGRRTTSGLLPHPPGVREDLERRLAGRRPASGLGHHEFSTEFLLERRGSSRVPALSFDHVESSWRTDLGLGDCSSTSRSKWEISPDAIPARRFAYASASVPVSVLLSVAPSAGGSPTWTVDDWQSALIEGLGSFVDAVSPGQPGMLPAVGPFPDRALIDGLRGLPTPRARGVLARARALPLVVGTLLDARLACGDPTLADEPIGPEGLRWSPPFGAWFIDVPLLTGAASRTKDERLRGAILDELRVGEAAGEQLLERWGESALAEHRAKFAPVRDAIDRGELPPQPWLDDVEARAASARSAQRRPAWVVFGGALVAMIGLVLVRRRVGLVAAGVVVGLCLTWLAWGSRPDLDHGVEIAGAGLVAVAAALLARNAVGLLRWIAPAGFAVAASADVLDWWGDDRAPGVVAVATAATAVGLLGLPLLAEARRRAVPGAPARSVRSWHHLATLAYLALATFVLFVPRAVDDLEIALLLVGLAATIAAASSTLRSLWFAAPSPRSAARKSGWA